MIRSARRIGVAIAVLAVGIVVAGCGGAAPQELPTGSIEAAATVHAAVEQTMAGPVDMHTVVDVEAGASGNAIVDLSGSYDFAAQSGALAIILTASGHKVRFTERLFADAFYYAGFQNKGVDWIRASRDDAKTHFLYRTPGNAPDELLRWAKAADHVTEHASENINGRETMHYQALIPPETLIENLVPSEQAKLPAAKIGNQTLDMDIYIDHAGRIARLAVATTGDGFSFAARTDFAARTKPVEVRRPHHGVFTATISTELTG